MGAEGVGGEDEASEVDAFGVAWGEFALQLAEEATLFVFAEGVGGGGIEEVGFGGALKEVVEVVGVDAFFFFVGGEVEGALEFVGDECVL